MNDKREFGRRPCEGVVDYLVIGLEDVNWRGMSLKARIIDISEGGVGIETEYPLEAGHAVHFNGDIGEIGAVRWSERRGSCYRAGIAFLKARARKPAHAVSTLCEP